MDSHEGRDMKYSFILSALILLGCNESNNPITGSDGEPVTGIMGSVQGKYISANGRLQMTFKGDSARIRAFTVTSGDEIRFGSHYSFQIDDAFEIKDSTNQVTGKLDTFLLFDDFRFSRINSDSSLSPWTDVPVGWSGRTKFSIEKSGDSIKTFIDFGNYVVHKTP